MSKIINLRTARKAKDKVKSRQKADENALRHGRTKQEKRAEELANNRIVKQLDAHKRET